jgi:hypothetical protein
VVLSGFQNAYLTAFLYFIGSSRIRIILDGFFANSLTTKNAPFNWGVEFANLNPYNIEDTR